MSKNDALLTRIEIPLSVPVPVKGVDGKEAERTKLVMHRPKLRHAKQLAVLIGQDVLETLVSEDEEPDTEDGEDKRSGRALVVKVLGELVSDEHLDGLTGLIADLCGEEQALIDDVDLVDLPAVGSAFLRFFPELRSAALTAWQAMSPSTRDGSRKS